jgi:hypothetical protein
MKKPLNALQERAKITNTAWCEAISKGINTPQKLKIFFNVTASTTHGRLTALKRQDLVEADNKANYTVVDHTKPRELFILKGADRDKIVIRYYAADGLAQRLCEAQSVTKSIAEAKLKQLRREYPFFHFNIIPVAA